MAKGTIAGYIRVSTQEQKLNGISIESQEAALRQYAADNGYNIEIYSDAGISAHISYKKRPALLRMIADCKAGKIQLICVTKLDRFFRSVPDYYKVFDEIKTPWRAIWEDYETETSAGQFKVNIMLSVAQAESDRTSERIKAVNQYKRDIGQYVGNLPFGYTFTRENGQRRIIKDENAPIIDLIIDSYKRTMSFSGTYKELKAAGYGHITKYIIKNVLTNDFYRGKANQEIFDAYVCPEDDELLKTAATRKTREKLPHKHIYLFSGLLSCPKCGCNMLGMLHYSQRKDKHNDVYKVYTCGRIMQYQGHPGIISESVVERMMMDEIDAAMAPVPQIKRVTSKANKDNTKQINALNSRLKRLADMYEMGDIEKDGYVSKRDEIKLEIIRLESSNSEVQKVPELPNNWRDVYNSLDPEHKKLFWNKVIKNAVIDKKAGTISIIWQ